MSRRALFTTKGRRAAAVSAAGLSACAVLAACSPVQAGAAATVGSQRITVSSLDTQVSNWQTAAKPYGSSIQLTSAQVPQAVLSWLIRFSVMDQVAASHGISVSTAQADAGLAALSQVATQNGFKSTNELLVANGLPPQLFPSIGRYEAEQDALAKQSNGGKEPSTTAEENTFSATLDKAQCNAAKSLDIKVSPQFGRFNFASTSFSVVDAPNTLSVPQPVPSPASTEGLTPAC